MNQQRILCLWLPSWSIQRLVVSQPELRRGQIVLFRRDPRRGQRVVVASPLAIRHGVRAEMSLSEAKSLLSRTGSAFEIFEHDPAADLAALKQFADSLSRFSPVVGWAPAEEKSTQGSVAATARSAILLDVTGLAHLFGDEAGLVHDLDEHCRETGYLARIAIADTIGMAWGLAHFGRTSAMADSYSAASSSPASSPASCSPALLANHSSASLSLGSSSHLIVPPQSTDAFRLLPIEALRLNPATIATLKQLGIETIEQVLRLPRPELAMRFGREIHDRLDQALGAISEPIVAHRPPAEFSAEQLLDYPTRHRETVVVIIGRLVTQICDRLRSRQHGALQWTVRMTIDSGEAANEDSPHVVDVARLPLVRNFQANQTDQAFVERGRNFIPSSNSRSKRNVTQNAIQFVVNLFQATATDSVVIPLIEMQLEQLQSLTKHPISEISVTVTSCVLLVQRQRQLFDENPRLDQQALAQLINRLTSRLGAANVVYPQLCSGAQPEYSYRFHPLVDVKRKKTRRRNQPGLSSHVAGRPLKIFRPAVPLRSVHHAVDSNAGSRASRPQARVPLRSFDSTVPTSASLDLNDHIIRRWGPERIETGWWRGLTVCRDYWRIEIDTGQQLWIYRDLRNGDWFLQGEF